MVSGNFGLVPNHRSYLKHRQCQHRNGFYSVLIWPDFQAIQRQSALYAQVRIQEVNCWELNTLVRIKNK